MVKKKALYIFDDRRCFFDNYKSVPWAIILAHK